MHPNYVLPDNYFVGIVDLCSLLAYFMMTQSLPMASKLSIKTFDCYYNRQLPTITNTYVHSAKCPAYIYNPCISCIPITTIICCDNDIKAVKVGL